MARVALGYPPRSGTRIVLDGLSERCGCPPAPALADVPEVVPARVIVRHRTRVGMDPEDGTPEYDWATVYDGPGIWSVLRETEDDDAGAQLTQSAQVTIGPMDVKLETTASVWDEDRRRWNVTGATTDTAGGVVIDVTRRVDTDG